METIVCTGCGTVLQSEYAAGLCPVCDDDRQFVSSGGQKWLAPDTLATTHNVRIDQLSDHVYALTVDPQFGIGQRAFLIETDDGNILWDCLPLLNDQVQDFIKLKGGLRAIAFSHPHFYGAMNEYAAFFRCPIYIHKFDEEFIHNCGPDVQLWEESEKPLWQNMRLIHIGGHFPGSSVLLVPSFSENGMVFCGDTVYISPSRRHISAMHSFPNQIPLPKHTLISVFNKVATLNFDTMHCAFEGRSLVGNAKKVFQLSFNRYKTLIEF